MNKLKAHRKGLYSSHNKQKLFLKDKSSSQYYQAIARLNSHLRLFKTVKGVYPSVFEHTDINILIYKDLHVKNSLESAS